MNGARQKRQGHGFDGPSVRKCDAVAFLTHPRNGGGDALPGRDGERAHVTVADGLTVVSLGPRTAAAWPTANGSTNDNGMEATE